MREITLTPTPTSFGADENPPLRVYDTSGQYTDSTTSTDIHRGLPPLRHPWIIERDDVEAYEGRTVQPVDNGLKPNDPRANLSVFDGLTHVPLRARPGRNVTQMHYAKQGIITPEMEFIAIREQVDPAFVCAE